MTAREVIENKISSIRRYLKILERYKGYSKSEIEENIDLRGAIVAYINGIRLFIVSDLHYPPSVYFLILDVQYAVMILIA